MRQIIADEEVGAPGCSRWQAWNELATSAPPSRSNLVNRTYDPARGACWWTAWTRASGACMRCARGSARSSRTFSCSRAASPTTSCSPGRGRRAPRSSKPPPGRHFMLGEIEWRSLGARSTWLRDTAEHLEHCVLWALDEAAAQQLRKLLRPRAPERARRPSHVSSAGASRRSRAAGPLARAARSQIPMELERARGAVALSAAWQGRKPSRNGVWQAGIGSGIGRGCAKNFGSFRGNPFAGRVIGRWRRGAGS
jgi:hypothetical protein